MTLQPLLNMFVFDPTYAYFLVIVVPNHEIMIRQETYVSCDEMEIGLQESQRIKHIECCICK